MNTPAWRNFVLDEGVLREAVLDEAQFAIWLKGEREGEFQYWERIWTAADATIHLAPGICAKRASGRRMCQKIVTRGWFAGLIQKFKKADIDSWTLPNGEIVQPAGAKQTDWALIWAEDESSTLSENWIHGQWPQAEQVRRIGSNLLLARGIELRPMQPLPEPISSMEPAHSFADALSSVEFMVNGASSLESPDTVTGSTTEQTVTVPPPGKASWPQMALSATKAAARFVGSGFKTVSQENYQSRMNTCLTCEHHTGVRCQVCGCITSGKAWLPTEECPLSKWKRECPTGA